MLTLSPKGTNALRGKASKALADAFETWASSDTFDEFSRVETIGGRQSGAGRHMTAVGPRRSMIVGALKELPPGEWVSVEEFTRSVRGAGYDFEVTRDPWKLYIGDAQYGNLGYSGVPVWDLVNKRYVLALLYEYVATLGLIDIAYLYPDQVERDYVGVWGTDGLKYLSRYDGLRYFRVNALGAYCLGYTQLRSLASDAGEPPRVPGRRGRPRGRRRRPSGRPLVP